MAKLQDHAKKKIIIHSRPYKNAACLATAFQSRTKKNLKHNNYFQKQYVCFIPQQDKQNGYPNGSGNKKQQKPPSN